MDNAGIGVCLEISTLSGIGMGDEREMTVKPSICILVWSLAVSLSLIQLHTNVVKSAAMPVFAIGTHQSESMPSSFLEPRVTLKRQII